MAAVLACVGARADTFVLPEYGDNTIGGLGIATVVHGDTLSDIARAYNQGFNEIRLANPGVDPWIPAEGTEVVIPSLYVLPDAPYEGIVINVPEMRLYYYPKAKRGEPRYVITHPISIGRQEWITPHGVTKVVGKVKNPSWYPPESIRKEHAELGDPLPKVVPPGPDNPLGKFALRLGIAGYLIHGTDKPYGIGMRVTHGCIRLYPEDIEKLFAEIPVGTPVRFVNQPFKVGRANDRLYLEVHPYLDEDEAAFGNQHTRVMQLIVAGNRDAQADLEWSSLQQALKDRSGMPLAIGLRIRPAEVAVE
jgi:L,D-transpeptidase ErfK/SrfK